MQLLFHPFFQCFVELSKILFNYSVPLFEIPLYVFIVLPLIFKILLIPISVSGDNLRTKDGGIAVYLKSRYSSKQSKKGGE